MYHDTDAILKYHDSWYFADTFENPQQAPKLRLKTHVAKKDKMDAQ